MSHPATGLQFTLHTADEYTIPEVGTLASLAESEGFDQVWVNDNLGYRQLFTALTVVASETDLDLGTAIMVPYFRNPVDVADTLVSISELTDGRISVGIGRGADHIAGAQVERRNPLATLAETPQMLRALVSGETVRLGEYEALASYFHLQEGTELSLGFEPRSPVEFLVASSGPRGTGIAGKHADGVLFGGSFVHHLRTGRLETLVESARGAADDPDALDVVAEINVSVSRDGAAAREFPKTYVAHVVPGLRDHYSRERISALGIDPANVDDVARAFEEGASKEEAADLVTDAMVEAMFVAGTPETCADRLEAVLRDADAFDVDQFVFAKLGPDYEEAIRLLGREVLPAVEF